MPYTYQNYLDDLEAEKAPEKSAPASTYKYSDYLAEQEADKPIKEWLKLQNRENAPITPEIRKRFEHSKTANPKMQPTAEWLEPTTGEKVAKFIAPAVAQTARFGAQVPESGANLYAGAGGIVDLLSRMPSGGMPRLEGNKLSELLYEQAKKGKELSETMAAPAREVAESPAEKVLQDLGAGGFGLALELPFISKAGLPAYSGLTSYGGTKAAGANEEDAALAGIGGVARGAGTHALFGLGSELPGRVLPKAATAAAMGAITKAEGGSWEDVGREALMAAILTGKKRVTELSEKELAILSAKDRERLWRLEQEKIQEADIKGKFDKLPQEMTPQEKAAEMADLRAKAAQEFGEVDNVAKTEIVPPGASGPQFEAPVPEVAEAHGGVAGKGRSVEELNRPFEYVKLTGGIQPDALGKTGDPRTNLQRGEPILKKFTDKDTGRVTLEIDDMNGADAQKTELIRAQYEAELNKKAPPPKPEKVKAPNDMMVPTQTGMELEIDKGENITLIRHGKNTFEAHDHDTGIIDLEQAARIDPTLKGELKDTAKLTPPTTNKLPTTEAPKPVAKPVEPTDVINAHSAKTVKQAAEIKNTTDELTEMMGEAATHLKMNLAEQGRMASELPPEVARDIALGNRKAPSIKGSDGHLLKEEAVWVVEKNRAIDRGDSEYIMELAKPSALQEQISQSGKSLVLLRGHAPHDPVYQIMEIRKQAEETVKKNLGNKKVAEVTAKRVAELERIIADQTKKIEDYENRKTIKEFKYEARKKGRLRTKEELGLEFGDLVKSFEHLTANQANIGLDPKVIKLMGRMAVNRVEAGIKTIEQVVDDIYTAVGEKIDKRVIRDAITGYGKRSTLSKDEIDKQLRELKRQGRLISQIEDAENGLTSLRSGLERDMPSDRVKELTRILEETKRKNGLIIEKELKEKVKRIPPTEEERQLTAIEKYKNYIKKRTADLEGRLTEGDYSVKPRKVTPIDSTLQNKKDHVTRLSKEYNRLKQLNELRTNGVTKEEAVEIINRSKIVSEKKALVTDWTDRSADGAAMEYGRALFDFHDHANGLKQRAAKVTKREWVQRALHGEFIKTGWHVIKTASGVSKSILSSMDDSAIGRQGVKLFYRELLSPNKRNVLWGKESVWRKNAKQSIIDLFGKYDGKTVMREIMADVLSRPNSVNDTYNKMKLDIGNIEEAYPEQAPERLPFKIGAAYKRTEAAFVGFQYRTRADVADMYLKIAEGYGDMKAIDMTSKEQLESIGRLVNTLTGRGHLGKTAERAAESLNNVFFAPKFLKSNWDILTAHRFTNDTPFVKKQAAINLGRFVAGTSAVLVIAKILGADIEANPQSSNFGKIKIGNTRFDVTGGAASVATFAVRLAGAAISGIGQAFGADPLLTTKSSLTGKRSALTKPGTFARNGLNVLVDFARGKLAPGASLFIQVISGTDLNRKEVNALNMFLRSVAPIGFQNAYENWSIKDKKLFAAALVADFFGVGTSTYGKEKKKSKWVRE